MEIQGKRFVWSLMVVFMLAMVALPGCASFGTARGGRTIVETVWQAGDQYVAIEKQDQPAGADIIPNAHPLDIPADRLRSALGSIEVRLPGNDKNVQLFSEQELALITENISKALARAGKDEDVTFAAIGHHTAVMGLFKERRLTAGRVFCRDGEINIIFGDLLRDVKENEDRRLYPILPGSRSSSAPRNWELTVKTGETFSMKRPDWITFPIMGPAVSVGIPGVPQETGATGTTVKPATFAPSLQKQAPPAEKSIEERLMLLNELRDKKLITEEEYRAKRLEILDAL
ncbi:MAG: SHOCT domain-containing protein [Geobacter sp.]|nr:SHOCT domain-containing protein [Geobacter sp.]